MKRRLSIAISLVGNPAIVMLDEPYVLLQLVTNNYSTTGLDPTSKRHLWDVILEAKKNRSIILTTHSMEEADALCDRIGIMHQGQMRCLGSALRLKNKFGGGFRVSINYSKENRDTAQQFIQNELPHAVLINEFAGTATYEISALNIKISQFFKTMENAKAKGNQGWENWSLSQCSLEDVFLRLVGDALQEEKTMKKKPEEKPVDATVAVTPAPVQPNLLNN